MEKINPFWLHGESPDHAPGPWERVFWKGIAASLLCYTYSLVGHSWRKDADLDEPLDRYWLLLLAFEMTGGNGTAISRSTNR